VFSDGFTLEAVQAVGVGGGIRAELVLDLVASLVNKSILQSDVNQSPARYRMLDTIRQYGLNRLASAGCEKAQRQRHRDYFLGFAEDVERQWLSGVGQRTAYERTRLEHANLRAALEFSLSTPGEGSAGLQLASALHFYWLFCGFLSEGRHWLERALTFDPQPSQARAKALWVTAYAANVLGDYGSGTELAEQCLSWARDHGDDGMAAHAVTVLGAGAMATGDPLRGKDMCDEGIAALVAAGFPTFASVAWAVRLMVAGLFGVDSEHGADLAARAIALCDAHGDQYGLSRVQYGFALTLWATGRNKEALQHCHETLRISLSFNDVKSAAMSIELIAWILGAAGEHRRAAGILGLVHRYWPLAGGKVWLGSPMLGIPHDECERRVRRALGDHEFDLAFRRGEPHGGDLQSAASYILGDDTKPQNKAPKATPGKKTMLTQREAQVADLLAQGMTNKEIAATLVIARRTVESHVEHVLEKLGFSSRSQVTAWVIDQRGS
jgi:non-specific serine/threonine protein kinase